MQGSKVVFGPIAASKIGFHLLCRKPSNPA
jgi:hypothetical protein